MKLLDTIALTVDIPEKGLIRGQVGTIVEILDEGIYEVEFSDLHGRTYAMLPLKEDQMMRLHHEPVMSG